ncbi:YceI family protein [Aggregatimonas sangjinii]|uniref:YceI family protein n=1 Tax=Aggregatimonas sangjinii TaxID=2583587 RepID=A0A5B7SP45_9FLAO|nr:YceI family protein [Aggregatimonas sangjinii]QCW98772.1 YceI family protein [Aggregatimonas sangjinii]
MRNTVKNFLLALFLCCSWMVTAQESYTLSAESVLTISGTSTVHDWEVAANSFMGSLTADGDQVNDLKIEVPVVGIKSERGPTMDNKMYAALKAEAHPSVYFSMKGVTDPNAMHGMLTIAGVEKEVEIVVNMLQEEGKMSVSGAQDLRLQDFGMEPPTAMFGQIVVGASVTVSFDLAFVRN